MFLEHLAGLVSCTTAESARRALLSPSDERRRPDWLVAHDGVGAYVVAYGIGTILALDAVPLVALPTGQASQALPSFFESGLDRVHASHRSVRPILLIVVVG